MSKFNLISEDSFKEYIEYHKDNMKFVSLPYLDELLKENNEQVTDLGLKILATLTEGQAHPTNIYMNSMYDSFPMFSYVFNTKELYAIEVHLTYNDLVNILTATKIEDVELLNNTFTTEIMAQTFEYAKKVTKEDNLSMLFNLAPVPLQYPLYTILDLYGKFEGKEDLKVELFVHMYTSTEYGFVTENYSGESENMFHKGYLEIKENLSKNSEYHPNNIEGITEEDTVKVYRGEGDKSATLDMNPLSWTLSYEIADFFAHRFNSNGIVHEGYVDVEDILLYIGGSEDEVIVESNKVQLI